MIKWAEFRTSVASRLASLFISFYLRPATSSLELYLSSHTLLLSWEWVFAIALVGYMHVYFSDETWTECCLIFTYKKLHLHIHFNVEPRLNIYSLPLLGCLSVSLGYIGMFFIDCQKCSSSKPNVVLCVPNWWNNNNFIFTSPPEFWPKNWHLLLAVSSNLKEVPLQMKFTHNLPSSGTTHLKSSI